MPGWSAISSSRCCRRTSAPKPPRMPVRAPASKDLISAAPFSSKSWVMYCFSRPRSMTAMATTTAARIAAAPMTTSGDDAPPKGFFLRKAHMSFSVGMRQPVFFPYSPSYFHTAKAPHCPETRRPPCLRPVRQAVASAFAWPIPSVFRPAAQRDRGRTPKRPLTLACGLLSPCDKFILLKSQLVAAAARSPN